MRTLSLPPLMIAGIMLYVGFYQILIYWRRRGQREYLTFALTCLAMGLYDLFCAGLYSSTSVSEGVRWQQLQISALALVSIALPWFVTDYLAAGGAVPRWWKRGLVVSSAYFALTAVGSLLNPAQLYWPADQYAIKHINLAGLFSVTYYEMAPGPLTNVQSVAGLLVFLYILWLVLWVRRRGRRRETRPLLAVLLLFFIGAISDTAVSSGLYEFVYLMEYAYLGAVLLMTSSITRQVAESTALMEQHAARLEALRQAGLDLAAQLDIDTLLHSLAQSAMALLGGSGGGLYLHLPGPNVLEWHISVGASTLPMHTVLHRGEGLAGRVWEQRRPLIVNDYQNWSGRAAVYAGQPNFATVSAPIMWGDEFLGVLNVIAELPHTFVQADADMLSLFATQAAVAIRNARLYNAARSQAERLAVVNHIAKTVGGTLQLDDLLQTVYRQITSIFRADSFFFALYDQETDEIEFPFQVDEGMRVSPERQPAGEGLSSLIIRQKKSLLIHDLGQEQARLPVPVVWGSGRLPASWLGVPICNGDRLVGIICVQAYAPHAYSADDELLLSTIADQVAVVLERVHLYQTIRASEERNRFTQFAVDRIADAAYWTDDGGRLIYVNDAACRSLGYTREELLGMRIYDLDPNQSSELWPEHWRQVRERGNLTYESYYRASSGRLFPVEVTANVLEFEGREYHCAFTHDITRRRQLEEQLRQAQKMEAIGTLAGGVAHDFNNILTSILGYASLVQQELPFPSPLHADMETIITSARRAADLTAQLLTFAHRSVQTEQQLLDLNGVVQEVAKLLERTIDKAISIEPHLRGDLYPVKGDASQLHQAILNLCLNARDAMPDGGRLILETQNIRVGAAEARGDLHIEPGAYTVLSVTDTGRGMDPAVQQRIFEPFYTTKEHGRGLGLAMVYGIVRGHNGAIHVYSEPGHGTTFRIYLPAQPGNAAPVTPPPQTVIGGTETILIVDDEEDVRQVLQRILERGGYTVVVARDGPEAIALCRQQGIALDLVVLDVIMPHMGGQETFRQLRQIDPQLKVLLSSGYSENGQAAAAMADGARGFLQKPYDMETVLRKVRGTLNGEASPAQSSGDAERQAESERQGGLPLP